MYDNTYTLPETNCQPAKNGVNISLECWLAQAFCMFAEGRIQGHDISIGIMAITSKIASRNVLMTLVKSTHKTLTDSKKRLLKAGLISVQPRIGKTSIITGTTPDGGIVVWGQEEAFQEFFQQLNKFSVDNLKNLRADFWENNPISGLTAADFDPPQTPDTPSDPGLITQGEAVDPGLIVRKGVVDPGSLVQGNGKIEADPGSLVRKHPPNPGSLVRKGVENSGEKIPPNDINSNPPYNLNSKSHFSDSSVSHTETSGLDFEKEKSDKSFWKTQLNPNAGREKPRVILIDGIAKIIDEDMRKEWTEKFNGNEDAMDAAVASQSEYVQENSNKDIETQIISKLNRLFMQQVAQNERYAAAIEKRKDQQGMSGNSTGYKSPHTPGANSKIKLKPEFAVRLAKTGINREYSKEDQERVIQLAREAGYDGEIKYKD